MTNDAAPSPTTDGSARSNDTTTQVPDEAHRRPSGATDLEVEAAGKVSEALEWIERARGALYQFHQLIGRADFLMEDAADLLDRAGAAQLADEVRIEAVGRNILDGRWTFQIVEEFASVYYRPVAQVEEHVRNELMDGKQHVYEAELKEQRRSRGRAAHESRPPGTYQDELA
jgi:hypothetical protein